MCFLIKIYCLTSLLDINFNDKTRCIKHSCIIFVHQLSSATTEELTKNCLNWHTVSDHLYNEKKVISAQRKDESWILGSFSKKGITSLQYVLVKGLSNKWISNTFSFSASRPWKTKQILNFSFVSRPEETTAMQPPKLFAFNSNEHTDAQISDVYLSRNFMIIHANRCIIAQLDMILSVAQEHCFALYCY